MCVSLSDSLNSFGNLLYLGCKVLLVLPPSSKCAVLHIKMDRSGKFFAVIMGNCIFYTVHVDISNRYTCSTLIVGVCSFLLMQDIDWVQTEKHVFEQASNHPFLVGLHSCFQTDSR